MKTEFLQRIYREETGKDPLVSSHGGAYHDSYDYVRWLEERVMKYYIISDKSEENEG